MAIELDSNRQYPLVATATVTSADVDPAGETFTVIELPAGARILAVETILVTAFADDAAETQLADIGTSGGGVADNPDAFTATELDIDGALTYLRAADSEVGFDQTYTSPVDITFTFIPSVGAAALTAGEIDIVVTYVIDGRANENQG